jgi:cytoskeletal protein RodZ
VNDRRLDAETAERMLRGEATGSPELAAVLAAASSGLAADDPKGEEAAVAAFREASRARQPRTRRLSVLLSLKGALIGLLLLLTGGVAVAATTQHLPGPLGHRHPDSGRTPATSRTYGTPSAPRASPLASPRASSRPSPDRNDPKTAHPVKPHHTKHKKAKKPKKTKKNKIGHVSVSVPAPTARPVEAAPGFVSTTG